MLPPASERMETNILLFAYAMYRSDRSAPLPVVKLLAESGGKKLCLKKFEGQTVVHAAAEDGELYKRLSHSTIARVVMDA